MLGEHITWRDLLGVLLAIIGAITVVISAKDSNPTVRESPIFRDFRVTWNSLLQRLNRWI
jgi:drug/metabolite transporter (DMT)-like permease